MSTDNNSKRLLQRYRTVFTFLTAAIAFASFFVRESLSEENRDLKSTIQIAKLGFDIRVDISDLTNFLQQWQIAMLSHPVREAEDKKKPLTTEELIDKEAVMVIIFKNNTKNITEAQDEVASLIKATPDAGIAVRKQAHDAAESVRILRAIDQQMTKFAEQDSRTDRSRAYALFLESNPKLIMLAATQAHNDIQRLFTLALTAAESESRQLEQRSKTATLWSYGLFVLALIFGTIGKLFDVPAFGGE